MIIGLDASGNFPAGGQGFESSAVAAATVPEKARANITAWTAGRSEAWNRADLSELHANQLEPHERREVCGMLSARDDLHVAVIITSNLLLRSEEMVAGHRQRQLAVAEQAATSAITEEGRRRGETAARLLDNQRVGRARMNDSSSIAAAMMPQVVMGAVQRAFCFYAGDEWRSQMSQIALMFDEDRRALMRYVKESFLAVLSDERFRLTTPSSWREEPVHPLLGRAAHPDGDGYASQELLSEAIAWTPSHNEPSVQVADFAAWVACRAVNRPEESEARECYELLMPILVGAGGRCFECFSLGRNRPDDEILYTHLPQGTQPPEWLERLSVGA